jgi:polyvinyl alcohol dehydrogenase (cytochrome)
MRALHAALIGIASFCFGALPTAATESVNASNSEAQKSFGALVWNLCQQAPKPLDLDRINRNSAEIDLDNSQFQSQSGINANSLAQLKLKWVYRYPGRAAYGQPTPLDDRVFVSTMLGQVTALDAQTGCAFWIYNAGAGVGTPLTIAAAPKSSKARVIAYFGDDNGYAHAIDAETGERLWRTKLDLHAATRISGAAKVHADRVYFSVSSMEKLLAANPKYPCCTFRGSLVALKTASGAIAWKSFTIADESKPTRKNNVGTQLYGPAGAPLFGSPTIDASHNIVYVATGDAYTNDDTPTANAVLAFDLKSGAMKWAKQLSPDHSLQKNCADNRTATCKGALVAHLAFDAPIILRPLLNGKRILLAGQKSGYVYGLDPDSRGKIIWQTQVGAGSPQGGIEWGMAADSEQVYVANSDIGNAMSAIPGITALRIMTGAKVWYVATPFAKCTFAGGRCVRAQSAAVTVIPGAVFSGAFDGVMRAYSTKDGSVLWQFDTGQTFKTVNGMSASGGNIDGAGPVIANGMFFMNSGNGASPDGFGQVMLVFEPGAN